MKATLKEGPVREVTAAAVLASALAVALVLLCGEASASGPGQVIVELQQNNGSDVTHTSEFYDQEIGGADSGDRQPYKFQRERQGRHFTYLVANLTPGAACQVELSFVEHDLPSSGLRVFNTYIGGARVLECLDIYAQGGSNNACRFCFGAAADQEGLVRIAFRSDEPGCTGDATVSTIRVYDVAGDIVEIDATSSRHRMDPPVRHYNNDRQNTLETILGRLGSRASLNLLPQRLASRISPLGTWTGDLSELVIALRHGSDVRCLPFTDRFPAWESIEQEQGMTRQSFDCRSAAMPLEMTAVFSSPFYPEDEKLCTAPFFYVDLSVRNTGDTTVSGEVLLARPHKDGFQECSLAEFSDADADGYTFEASYQYQEETRSECGARSAVEALAVPSGEKDGVRFHGLTEVEFSDFSPDRVWGWRSPDGYPLTYNKPKSPTFTFYPRGYSGALWAIDGLEPGGTESRRFILAGYVPGTVLSVKNRHYQDGGFRFKYRGHFSDVRDVVGYAAASGWGGNGIEEKSEFFDSLFCSDEYFHLNAGHLDDVRDLMACAFQSYLTNTWWVHSDDGRDWFSVWEGTWMRLHGTVDVEYNQAWFYLELWPELLRMIMDQWLLYTESNETGEYLPHDIGILDTAYGQVYEHPMPVEENTNFILLLYRYWQRTGDTSYMRQRFPDVRRLVDFLVNCDTNNNGLPDIYTRNTLDDGPPALEGARDQTYLGVKCMAAYQATIEMAGALSTPDDGYAGRCRAQVELINQTLEYDQWLSDHFAVCQDGGVPAAGREAYSIHSGNGLLYLLGAGRDVGLTSGNTERMRLDVEGSTGRTLRKYGCTHTSDDPTRMWVSANLWRDQVACHLGASTGDGGPLALCARYWDMERYFGTYLQGGYWDGVVYPACGVSASPIWGAPAAGGNSEMDTGIVAERPIYFNRPGNVTGGHVVMGASDPGATFYFAEGTCRPGFDPYICIQNPGSTTATVRVTYMLGDGTTRNQDLDIGANSRATVVVKDFLGEADDPAHDFSARVETTNGCYAQLMSYYPRGVASLGLLEAVAGLTSERSGDALYYRPAVYPLKVPLPRYADWGNPDPEKRVPTIAFGTPGSDPAVTNRGLLPATVEKNRTVDLGGSGGGGHALSPNGDGANDRVDITYQLPVASTVEESIWGTGEGVREIGSSHRDAGEASFSWDGRNGDGEVVDDGLYTARVDARPDNGDYAVRPWAASIWVNRSIPDLSTDWYLAEGFTGASRAGGEFEEYVLIQNPNPGEASVDITFMLPGGETRDKHVNVVPNSRFTVNVDEILPACEVSVHVHADKRIAVERSMYWRGRGAGHASVGVTRPETRWYLAEGCTAGGFDEFILIQNPGEVKAEVDVTFMTPDSGSLKREYTVGARSRFTIHVNEFLPSSDVSAVIESTVPVVVERSQYLDDMRAGTCSIAAPSLSRTWFLAEGYTGGSFEEWVLIQNPGDAANEVTLTFMESTGANTVRNYTLAPASRFSLSVDEVVPDGEVSVKVRAAQPVLAERSMYWNNRSDGHCFIGTPSPDTEWFLAEGYTGGGFETWILVQNPGDDPVSLTFTFMEPGGKNTVREYAAGARSRFTVALDEILPASEVSTRVTASGFVIVERAIYFNNRSGGTDSLGVRGR